MKSYLRQYNQACFLFNPLESKDRRGNKQNDEKSERQKRHNVRGERQRPGYSKGLIITAKEKAD